MPERGADASRDRIPSRYGDLTTRVPSVARLYARIHMVAAEPDPVLVLGETGTGKEEVARALHLLSGRSGEFHAVNVSALPANLVERELFGAVAGAYTGATSAEGVFRAAHRGTLLLDEVGDLALPAQAKVLRAIQEREVRPVGGVRPIPVDVRVVAATHVDLRSRVARGEFREDLYARLAFDVLPLPPLRDRLADLPELVRTLLARCARGHVVLADDALERLARCRWPWNLRQLDAVLRRSSRGRTVIRAEDLDWGPDAPEHHPTPRGLLLGAVDVVRAVEDAAGNKSRAARELGISRGRLLRLLGYGASSQAGRAS